ncbi:uncharacterized protein LOC131334464 isoform X1 [Rhododendron vialii]|uniref:uncharacterized protein LOC131334464 isoform X1 n=1 Tax=Rhododendron vialii TaxID=182163 RepID=UPI00265FF322|nr:uncharacterized protein LOC131334464 isoform X1 [Rhododendron vialii]
MRNQNSLSEKSSAKTTREERLEMIDELTQHRELLKGEIEAVKSYYNTLKVINWDLKETKREVIWIFSLIFLLIFPELIGLLSLVFFLIQMEMCKKFGVELGKFNMVENQRLF